MNKGKWKILSGTILQPEVAGLKLTLNVANMGGNLNSPMYQYFDKKWKKVREQTRGWYVTRDGSYKLGAIQDIAVQSDIWIVNMLYQNDELKDDKVGLESCLKKVCALAKYETATVQTNKDFLTTNPELEVLLKKHLIDQGVSVYVYES